MLNINISFPHIPFAYFAYGDVAGNSQVKLAENLIKNG